MEADRFYEPDMLLKIETAPQSEVKPSDVLIRVKAFGLCGSDIHIY